MPAHRVPGYGDAGGVEEGERSEEGSREFRGDVGLHFVVLGVGRRDCVKVKGGASAEVPAVIFAGEFQSS